MPSTVFPSWSVYFPAGHSVHEELPTYAYLPPGHVVHEAELASLFFPGWHSSQWPETALEYVPAAHGTQAVVPAALDVPAGQSSQFCSAFNPFDEEPFFPAGHDVHEALPDSAYLPASQL